VKRSYEKLEVGKKKKKKGSKPNSPAVLRGQSTAIQGKMEKFKEGRRKKREAALIYHGSNRIVTPE